jgi:peptidoglycan hydrolase-like protein with peptidoglycan-binding domain
VGAAGAVDLTPDQIRQVQMVLIQKGFNIGEPDGRLGPRTRQALIAFQRQQGFQASGRIDSRTMTALGVSNAQGAGQSSTTGQGGATQQQAPSQRSQGQPSTSGQGGATQEHAPAQKNQGAGQPSTRGQGGAGQGSEKMQQPRADQGQQESGSK